MRKARPCDCQRGFTLVELMVTISVMVILLAVAVPSMHRFTVRNQLTVERDGLADALGLAYMTARLRGTQALLVANSASYVHGWQVCVDDDMDGTCDGGVAAVRAYPPPPADVVVSGNTSLPFGTTGAPVGGASTFTVCPAFGGSGYAIQLNASGTVDVDAYAGCP